MMKHLLFTFLVFVAMGVSAQGFFSMRGGAAIPLGSFYHEGYPVVGNITFDYHYYFPFDSSKYHLGIGARSRFNVMDIETINLVNGDDYLLSTYDIGIEGALALMYGDEDDVILPYVSLGYGIQGYYLYDEYRDWYSTSEYESYSNAISNTVVPILDLEVGANVRLSEFAFLNMSVAHMYGFREVNFMAVNSVSYNDGVLDYRMESERPNQLIIQLGLTYKFSSTFASTPMYSSTDQNCDCRRTASQECNQTVLRRQRRRYYRNNGGNSGGGSSQQKRRQKVEYKGKTPVLR